MNDAPTSLPDAAPPAPTPGVFRDLAWLLLGLGFLYLLPAGLRPLSNPDEGRYVEIAREMAATGEWISPRLNGVLYFEKPPLFYWLEAAAVKAGGTNLWALRFWPAALALLGCAMVYLTGRTWWGRLTGWCAGWALGTSLLYYGIGETIILDMAVSVFITGALCAFGLAVRAPPGPQRRQWCMALYVCMALALMTKGLIGVLIPCAVVFLFLLVLNRWRELRHAHLGLGVVIILVLALPWHIAASLAHPPPGGWDWAHFVTKDMHNQGFAWFYFWHEHVLRYLDPKTSDRVQPFWFFFLILPAGFFPWVVFLPSALKRACTGGWARLKADPETVLLILWALFPLLFFSASSSKLITYILPSVPPLALLAARFITQALRADRPALNWPLRAFGVFSLLIAVALPIVLYVRRADTPPGGATMFYALVPLFLAGGIGSLVVLGRNQNRQVEGLLILSLVWSAFLLAFNPLARYVQRPSTQPVAEVLLPQLQAGDAVYTLWDYGPFQDLPVYLGQTVGLAGQLPDEQLFGALLEPQQLAPRYPGLLDYLAVLAQPQPTREQMVGALLPPFINLLRGPQRVFVVAATAQFPVFQQRFPDAPAYVWWLNRDFVLFSNQPKP